MKLIFLILGSALLISCTNAGEPLKGTNGTIDPQEAQGVCGSVKIPSSIPERCGIRLVAPVAAEVVSIRPNRNVTFSFTHTGVCRDFELILTGRPFNGTTGENIKIVPVQDQAEILENEPVSGGSEVPAILQGVVVATDEILKDLTSSDGKYNWTIVSSNSRPVSECFVGNKSVIK